MASVAFSQVEVKLHQDNRELRSLSVSIGYNFFLSEVTMFYAGRRRPAIILLSRGKSYFSIFNSRFNVTRTFSN